MKLGIDIDGCLANFNKSFAALLQKRADRFPPTWKEDFEKYEVPEWISEWDYDKLHGFTQMERMDVWQEIKQSDFWFNLEPLNGAVDTIEHLNKLSDDHEVYFITTRMGRDAKQQTEDWLFQHGMVTPTVLISGLDKSAIIKGLGLNFFVDDKFENVYKAAQVMDGRTVFMVDCPYNQGTEIPHVTRVKSVREALDKFIGELPSGK